MRILNGGGYMVQGNMYLWQDWSLLEALWQFPLFKNESFTCPDVWLADFFDVKKFAFLLPGFEYMSWN